MKRALFFFIALCIMHGQFHATVKTFVNNSSKKFLVRVYYNNGKLISMKLAPGEIQDLFIPHTTIDKIAIVDELHASKIMSAMTHNQLKKNSSAINNNSIFILNQNSSIKMYKGRTNRDKALQEIDAAYINKSHLPTIDLSIHTIKGHQAGSTQDVGYKLHYKTHTLGSIKSTF